MAKTDKQIDALARSLSVQCSTYLSWGKTYDEAIQTAIEDIFLKSSDDFKADLFARICEGGSITENDLAKIIGKAL